MLHGQGNRHPNPTAVTPQGGPPGWREYQSIGVQLRSIMREACGEPPVGADLASVEKRINMLQCAIEEVEQRKREKQYIADMNRAKELQEHLLRRAKLEEERMQETRRKFEERDKNARELQEERKMYLRNRNQQIDTKINMCRVATMNQQTEVLERGEEESEKRNRVLLKLQEERERALQEHKEKSRQRMEHCREVLQRRKQRDEAIRREKKLAYLRRQEELTKCQAAQVEYPRDISPIRKEQRNRSQMRNEVREESVYSEPTPKAKGHDLLKQLREKEQQHQERYEAEKAVRLYEIQQRAMARKERQEKQQRNYVEVLEKRLHRGDEIIALARKKKLQGERAREQREARDVQAGEAVSRDVEVHHRRAEEFEQMCRNDTLQKNYRRWNERAERVLQLLQEAMIADSDITPGRSNAVGFLPQLNHLGAGSKDVKSAA